jgi:hypothetical protein
MRESWENHSLDSIDLLLRQIKAILASVEVSRDTLAGTGQTAVRCRMADARERGMKGLQNFADALRDATHGVALKALQDKAVDSLSDLSDVPKNGINQRDLNEQNPTKSKPSDKGRGGSKAKH